MANSSAPALERRMVDVGDASLEVFVGGNSDGTLLCTTHTHNAQKPDPDWISEHHRVIRVNPRGLGASTPPRLRKELTFGQAVRDLEAVRQRLGIDRWVFMGGSAGGFVGLRYAIDCPASLSGLIVSSACPYWQDAIDNPESRAYFSWVRAETGRWVRDGAPDDDISINLWGVLDELPSFDAREQLPKVRVPTLIWCGHLDTLVPVGLCRQLAALIPGAQLLVQAQSGHGPSNEDQPLYRATVLKFLSERPHRER